MNEIISRAKSVGKLENIWPFVRAEFQAAGFDVELIHGTRHVMRVKEECKKLIQMCGLNDQVAKCLKVAVDLHDIGRTLKGDHAQISAEIFDVMPIADLSKEEKEIIFFAIKNHSKGLVGLGIDRAETDAEKVLGLLVVCDHADAASTEGAARSILVLKGKPTLSLNFSALDLVKLMEDGCPFEMMNTYKNDSILAHWAYNYYATSPILERVRHLLSDEYLKYYNANLAMFRALINALIDLQD